MTGVAGSGAGVVGSRRRGLCSYCHDDQKLSAKTMGLGLLRRVGVLRKADIVGWVLAVAFAMLAFTVVCYAGFGFGGAFGWYAECAWKHNVVRAASTVN
tara:strand:- start:328 stop:624 length:297 start_codon:yes stop_codon:yes gene_type:complete